MIASGEKLGRKGVMQWVAANGDEPQGYGQRDDKQDYIPAILEALQQRDLSLRALALRSGIKKSRLGLLLHREPAKRSGMTVAEFQRIVAALDMDMIEAVVTVEIVRTFGHKDATRHRTLIAMLCEMFRALPAKLIDELDAIDGVDGTEARVEWAPVLQRAVIKRLVHEIAAVAGRRAALGDFDIFS